MIKLSDTSRYEIPVRYAQDFYRASEDGEDVSEVKSADEIELRVGKNGAYRMKMTEEMHGVFRKKEKTTVVENIQLPEGYTLDRISEIGETI
ncbi:MAG: hypothetical protein ABEJ56_00620 [Candidatus Nanohaloarchaea archaeon]